MNGFYKFLDFLILLLILILSSIATYSILSNYVNLVNNQLMIVEKEILIDKNFIINENDIKNILDEYKINNNINIDLLINDINKDDYNEDNNFSHMDIYKMEYKNKEFLISNNPKSYEYGFIAKDIKDNIMYLYSHNNYKFTENSGYFLYNNLKEGSIITFNDKYKYKVISTHEINYDNKEENKDIKIKKWVDIIYFTCTPSWDNIRKIYQLKKIN